MILTMMLALTLTVAGAQELLVKDYTYRLVSTDLSPRQAIRQALREALTACVQENLGTSVMNLTRLEKQEDDLAYRDRFTDFTQQISAGYVKRYRITDTVSVYHPEQLALETRIVLDITLQKPDRNNEIGLDAASGKAFYRKGEAATVNWSVKRGAWCYLFDLNFRNEFCLIFETKAELEPNTTFHFPGDRKFELAMTKEDANTFEFGSFVVLASEKPLNFGVPAAVDNGFQCSYLTFDRFFTVFSGIRKDHSIIYLPYCIE
jgi:hypothetical protein